MSFRIPEHLVNVSGAAYGAAAIATVILLVFTSRKSSLNAIPTVGSNSWFGSLWDGLMYHTNVASVIQQGYEKHKSSPFKVADLYRWNVILIKQAHVEELLRASNDDFSVAEANKDRFHFQYVFPPEMNENDYHLAVIRSQLTRNIGAACPTIRDEIVTAFDEVLDLKENEWKSVPALGAVQKIVCRTSNRLFVGLPLCRDPDWVDLNVNFAIDFATTVAAIGSFPNLLKPVAAMFFRATFRGIARGAKLLGPTVEERLRCLSEYGKEGAELPNDLLSWLILEANGVPLTAESLASRVLGINMAAILTTSNAFTHALFNLAANPQYIQPLREEVDTIIEKEGWTKTALVKMRKVDSFLKECQRMTATYLGLRRKAMKDYTFSDGTFIPRGTMVGVCTRAIHYDDRFYDNAHAFEPFRFVGADKDGEGVKNRFVSTGTDFLPFGHGKNACPGRFFATNELKLMMAHLVVTYDIKLESDATAPCTLHAATATVPNPETRILFKKRVGIE